MVSTDIAVRLRGLSRSFGAVTAVHPIDLDIPRGDFLAILGPSGCGKTTLLRMMGGFVEPTAGRIEVNGADITHLGPEHRPINMVFQGYGLFPHMNARQNVGYGLRLKKLDRAAVAKTGRRGHGAGAARWLRGPYAVAALRRAAAARRLGPRVGHGAAGAAARRAAGRARSEAAPGDAGRVAPHPSRDRRHLRLRHPRPGRGAGPCQPDRGDEGRPDRAAWHAGGNLSQAGDALHRRLHRRGKSSRSGQRKGGRDRDGLRHRLPRRGRDGRRRAGRAAGERAPAGRCDHADIEIAGTVEEVVFLGATSNTCWPSRAARSCASRIPASMRAPRSARRCGSAGAVPRSV